MVSAQRAATPGATEPTVRKAVRSIQSGGAVFTCDPGVSAQPEYARERDPAQSAGDDHHALDIGLALQ
jgi:hypothetical protein